MIETYWWSWNRYRVQIKCARKEVDKVSQCGNGIWGNANGCVDVQRCLYRWPGFDCVADAVVARVCHIQDGKCGLGIFSFEAFSITRVLKLTLCPQSGDSMGRRAEPRRVVFLF